MGHRTSGLRFPDTTSAQINTQPNPRTQEAQEDLDGSCHRTTTVRRRSDPPRAAGRSSWGPRRARELDHLSAGRRTHRATVRVSNLAASGSRGIDTPQCCIYAGTVKPYLSSTVSVATEGGATVLPRRRYRRRALGRGTWARPLPWRETPVRDINPSGVTGPRHRRLKARERSTWSHSSRCTTSSFGALRPEERGRAIADRNVSPTLPSRIRPQRGAAEGSADAPAKRHGLHPVPNEGAGRGAAADATAGQCAFHQRDGRHDGRLPGRRPGKQGSGPPSGA